MSQSDLAHLELLAEIDTLMADLRTWSEHAPDWPAARQAQSLVRRLADRTDALRIRLEAPLVVATLGGTGTGKSSLVNAILGAQVAVSGRERPTTRQPTLICRPDIEPAMLGIDPESVHVVERDYPVLRDLVFIDCPDPDTTEDPDAPGTNLAQLHNLLPHCDVLLVTTTQQKYRSARVADELAAAASGARLVFVQTHADVDDDIREDWRNVLSDHYASGEIFFIDSLTALADSTGGLQPRGEFARLLELLTRELASTAGARIRRANFLDLVDSTIAAAGDRMDRPMAAVEQLESGVNEQRTRLVESLTRRLRDELLGSRGAWEDRLLGEIGRKWGFSPFACVLRVWQGLGGLLSGAMLMRARSTAQLALWGVVEGGRNLRKRWRQRQADAAGSGAVGFGWDDSELRTAAIIIDGYAIDAGIEGDESARDALLEGADEIATRFIADASQELQASVARLAGRHTHWFTRFRYEAALLAMIVLLLYRYGRNFFFDSWLAFEFGLIDQPAAPLGFDFFLGAAVFFLLWCGLLLWLFTARLRRGLTAEVNDLVARWNQPQRIAGVFAGLEERCRDIRASREGLARLERRVAELKRRIPMPGGRLGHRVA